MEKPKITKLYELAGAILCLYKNTVTVNPYNTMAEKIDLSGYFYRTHKEDVYRLYHLLVHGMTCLNQVYRLQDKEGRYQSTREDNIVALYLLQDEYFNHDYLPGSVWDTYVELMGYYGSKSSFTRQQATLILHLNSHTAKWHLNKLREHGYLIKTGGDMRSGYIYRLVDKLNPFNLVHTLKESEDEPEESIFETMQPDVKPKWPLQ